MRAWKAVTVLAAAAAAAAGCAQKPPATATIEDKIYTVTPDQVRVIAGIVTGEITGMTITERVEKGTGRIESPARLTGQLKLTNGSTDQSVRLLGVRILYMDGQGQLIEVGEGRTPPALKYPASYNSPDRLDPGQNATQAIEVDFPAAALEAKKLREIRLELAYLPSPYQLQTAKFAVTIGGQPLGAQQ